MAHEPRAAEPRELVAIDITTRSAILHGPGERLRRQLGVEPGADTGNREVRVSDPAEHDVGHVGLHSRPWLALVRIVRCDRMDEHLRNQGRDAALTILFLELPRIDPQRDLRIRMVVGHDEISQSILQTAGSHVGRQRQQVSARRRPASPASRACGHGEHRARDDHRSIPHHPAQHSRFRRSRRGQR